MLSITNLNFECWWLLFQFRGELRYCQQEQLLQWFNLLINLSDKILLVRVDRTLQGIGIVIEFQEFLLKNWNWSHLVTIMVVLDLVVNGSHDLVSLSTLRFAAVVHVLLFAWIHLILKKYLLNCGDMNPNKYRLRLIKSNNHYFKNGVIRISGLQDIIMIIIFGRLLLLTWYIILPHYNKIRNLIYHSSVRCLFFYDFRFRGDKDEISCWVCLLTYWSLLFISFSRPARDADNCSSCIWSLSISSRIYLVPNEMKYILVLLG